MRREELEQTINQALGFSLANLHTITLCKVEAVGEKTIDCKPVTNRTVNGKSVELPLFTKVPPVFMSGGSSYTAHPIAIGDYCLLLITERCFDSWYEGSDYVAPLEKRMHDYSDGLALVGVKNKAGAITIPDVITQIGDMFAQGNWEHVGNLDRIGDETVEGDRTHTGSITITDTVQASTSILGAASFTSIETSGQTGVSGSFTTVDNKTVTVTNGIITSIV